MFQEDTDAAVTATPAIPITSAARTWSILKYSEPGYGVTEHADPFFLCPLFYHVAATSCPVGGSVGKSEWAKEAQ